MPLAKNTFKCDSVGRFTYPGSCEKYYFCWSIGEAFAVFTCPHPKAFDPVTQLCVYNFAACAVAPKCNFDNHILPNPNDKSTFFVCKFRYLSKKFALRKHNCATGRAFNAELGYCISKFQFLDDNISPNSDSDSFENVECERPGIFIDYYHSNEYKYYECIVKSASKGTFKLKRHKFTDHVFNVSANDDGVRLQCVWFKLQLIACFVHIILNVQF